MSQKAQTVVIVVLLTGAVAIAGFAAGFYLYALPSGFTGLFFGGFIFSAVVYCLFRKRTYGRAEVAAWYSMEEDVLVTLGALLCYAAGSAVQNSVHMREFELGLITLPSSILITFVGIGCLLYAFWEGPVYGWDEHLK